MYAESRYIGEAIEYVIPMYPNLAENLRYIGAGLMEFIPMYAAHKIWGRYIGMEYKFPAPMYQPLKLLQKYIGVPWSQAIPMYLQKISILDTSEQVSNNRFRCIEYQDTSESQVHRPSRCIIQLSFWRPNGRQI